MNWVCYALAILWILDALRMRGRLKLVPVLGPAEDSKGKGNSRFFTTPGVNVSEGVKGAALSYTQREGLELLDLVPADTPTLIALSIAQLIDPKTYRQNRIGPGYTAGYAFVASEELLSRAQAEPPATMPPVPFRRAAKTLKRFAKDRAGLVIAPGLRATGDHVTGDWEVFVETVGGNSHGIFLLRAIMLLILFAGLVLAPKAGLIALIAFHLQPVLALGGLALRPSDFWLMVFLRTPVECWRWLQTAITRARTAGKRTWANEGRRAHYAQAMAGGVGRFLEPRRDDCPICGSRDLKVRIRTTDIIQHKPGQFTLEQCQSCGHVFQNPRLTPEGLNFYYSDFYDGMGTRASETMFGARPSLYLQRARTVEGFLKPTRWLDVGTGQGHFCCAAREAWPHAEFDGLDISEGMDDAVRAGWMNRGYRGFLPDVANDIAGQYDVVSLFHCLEHTPEPVRDLEAAHTALAPGGMLVIEVPNPECSLGRVFGRLWLPWFQPQHLNMFSVSNLESTLRRLGFEPVRVQREEAHIPIDAFCFTMMFLGWLGPKPNLPWRQRPTWFSHVRHFLVWNLGFPFILLAMIIDAVGGRLLRRMGVSNAYRIVARRVEKPVEAEPQLLRSSSASSGK